MTCIEKAAEIKYFFSDLSFRLNFDVNLAGNKVNIKFNK